MGSKGSKAVVLLLLIPCLLLLSLFIVAPIVCCGSVLAQFLSPSIFAINIMENRRAGSLLYLSYLCLVTVTFLCLYLTVLWVHTGLAAIKNVNTIGEC